MRITRLFAGLAAAAALAGCGSAAATDAPTGHRTPTVHRTTAAQHRAFANRLGEIFYVDLYCNPAHPLPRYAADCRSAIADVGTPSPWPSVPASLYPAKQH